MRKIAIAVFTIALLTSCALFQGKPPATVVFEIRSGYDAAVLVPAAHYNTLTRCATPAVQPCSDPKVVDILRKADAAAKATLDAAEDTVRNHPTVDASFAVAAAQNAVDAAVKIIATYGVK